SDAGRNLHPRLHPRVRSYCRAPRRARPSARRRSATLNCGYGRGFFVLEVIESVKRVSGVDFKVEFAGRPAGDPAQLVAACDRVRAMVNWKPRFDDLATIVSHALDWERRLQRVPVVSA